MAWRQIARILCVLFISTAVQAHSPGLLDPAKKFHVDDATISRALYGVFETGNELFIVRLAFPRDFAFPFELFVPVRAELKHHRPAYAIVGTNLPTPSAEELTALPASLPAGAGAYVNLHRISPRPIFYESFTRRFFYSSGVTAYALAAGEYEFWIWSPQGSRGKFGIGFGVEERLDFADALANWSDYAY